MDIYLLYAYVGVVCAAVIAIILNRVKSTEYKETIDKMFCRSLMFFIAFCIVDAIWGFVGSARYFVNRTVYTIASYGFHFMAAWASYICSGYVIYTLNLSLSSKKIFKYARGILIALQNCFIIQNIFTGLFFTINDNAVYQSGVLRPLSFVLQFFHYIPIIIYSISHLSRKKNDETTGYIYGASMIFSIIPLIFGILQMCYPDGSFYSLGFLVTSVTMYAFNVTDQRESYLAAYYTAEEYKKSQAQIEEALDKAKKANDAKTVFLANMSHDIRTPINGIMGMVTLAKKEEMSDKVYEYIRKIDIASHHLLSLVNDVLDLSRIERGKTEIVTEPTDIRVIIDNCSSIIQGQIEDGNVNFEKICDDFEHPNVFADVLHIRQVLINILGNAIKFTPDGGNVTFKISEKSNDGDIAWYEFVISDTGIGMSPEFIGHIFEAFAQENNTSRANYQGTGLGMTISHQFVQLMGGKINIESEVGKGSTFTVELPLKINHDVKSSKKHKDQDISLSGVKIMLVEDNELNMEIAHSLLTESGAVITEAQNGKIAKDLFIEKPVGSFDVILMDIMMPEMNGYDAARAIRSSEKADAKTISIIAMTANAFAEDKIKAMEAGMNAHTAKPINFTDLVEKISDLLDIE